MHGKLFFLYALKRVPQDQTHVAMMFEVNVTVFIIQNKLYTLVHIFVFIFVRVYGKSFSYIETSDGDQRQ